jgi:hypothetical protein
MTYLKAGIKPEWVSQTDRTVDASDAWMEATDPENERGEVCMAHMRQVTVPCIDERHECFNGTGFELIGISVRDTTGTFYGDREWATKMLGVDVIWHLEEYEMEAA